jgi:DNA polymerase III epsilon subunit-like protein
MRSKCCVMVDVEADGPAPGLYSMIELGAVVIDEKLTKSFYTTLCPISDKWVPEALSVTGCSREQTLKFVDPATAIQNFADWLKKEVPGRPMFISDNNGFDWQFVNYYCWRFLEHNPFGHSSTNLGSLYKGLRRDMFVNFKHLRRTPHTHNPVDDALGNAQALLTMIKQGLKF